MEAVSSMSKILVEVRVPAAGTSSDVWIPYESRMRDVLEMLKVIFAEEAGSGFTPTTSTVLCDGMSGVPLDIGSSAQELGLRNGSVLMLV